MKIVVDLNTRILASNHQVFMIRPGAQYHLFESLVSAKAIAPDIPLLSIPDGVRPNDYADLDVQIRRGRTIRDWARSEETRGIAVPSRDLEGYRATQNAGQHGRFVTAIDEILWSLPTGSLVYVPNFSLADDALFGELRAETAPRLKVRGSGHFHEFEYLARGLNSAKRLPMRHLPKGVLESKKKNTTVVEIDGRDRLQVYRKFYGDFEILGQRTLMEVVTTKPRFTSPDAAIIGALTTMVQEAWDRHRRGDNTVPGLLEAAFMDLGDSAPSIHANINSPGRLLVESPNRTPHVVKLMFALALVLTPAEIMTAAHAQNLQVENSGRDVGMPDASERESEEFLFHFVRNAGAKSVGEIVENVRRVHERTGGNVDATVKR